MAGRTVDEWIGKTPDTAVPGRVRARVFSRFGGVCQLTGRKIMPGDAWDLDHTKPLHMGGENREANLQPVLREAHRNKTASEAPARAKTDRVRAKHLGIKRRKGPPMPGSKASKWKRRVDGTVERRT